MNGKDRTFLNERLTVLETKFSERWDTHDERATELKDEVKGMRETVSGLPTTLFNHIKNLPCARHSEGLKWLWIILGGAYFVIGIVFVGLIKYFLRGI